VLAKAVRWQWIWVNLAEPASPRSSTSERSPGRPSRVEANILRSWEPAGIGERPNPMRRAAVQLLVAGVMLATRWVLTV
jgi:hypothetical protein